MKIMVLICNADGSQELVEREVNIPAPPDDLPMPEEE